MPLSRSTVAKAGDVSVARSDFAAPDAADALESAAA
jgi:hypothetical protein